MIRFTFFVLAGALLLHPSTLPAQQSVSGVETTTPVAPIGPVLTVSTIYRPIVVELPREQATVATAQNADRSNVAWMAVGAAALMIGMLIGGDAGTVVAVTGGVIGLVGLFRYLQ